MMHGYGSGMWGMWMFGLLALAGLVILVVLIVRIATGGFKGAEERSTPRQILDRRYAKGDLSTQECRERLAELGENT